MGVADVPANWNLEIGNFSAMLTLERMTSWFRRSSPVAPGRKVAQPLRDENPQRYLDPAALARFGLSPMLARLVVEGFINGLHKSPFHGFSVEFADHREYVPGDDLKYLDWPLYARTDHYYIKRYEDQTNVRCHLLLDASGSMGFGTGALTKWDYACFMCTCLAYLMTKQQDAVGMTLMRDGPALMVPPRSRSSHLRQLMSVMIRNPPAGQTDLPAALRATVRNLKRRSLVVLVSDLIDEPEETLAAIRLIGGHKHDVVVFHVNDAAEQEFFFEGPTLFRDMETGEELEVDPAAVRQAYLEKLDELQSFYRKGLSEVGIDYQPINTAQRYDQVLSAYLRRRVRLGK
jgi:uncharacterized protein (DUF58 family)